MRAVFFGFLGGLASATLGGYYFIQDEIHVATSRLKLVSWLRSSSRCMLRRPPVVVPRFVEECSLARAGIAGRRQRERGGCQNKWLGNAR